MLTTVNSTIILECLGGAEKATAWRRFSARSEPMLLAFARRGGHHTLA
jgi:hypothetical protein